MKYLGRWVVVGFVGLGSVVSACSDPDEPSPAAASDFVEQLAQATCAGLAPCCQRANIAYDQATCLTNARAEFADDLGRLSGPKFRYEASAAGGCLTEVKRVLAACEEFEDDTTGVACAGVFVGTLAEGATCTRDEECADQANCLGLTSGGTGICGKNTDFTFTHGKLGEACAGECSGAKCQVFGEAMNPAVVCYESDGLSCNGSVCAQIVGVGEACDGMASCNSTAYCDTTLMKCVARKPEGAACTTGPECQRRDCNSGICQRDPAASENSCQGKL